jgi:hypothetical protein
MIFPLDSYSVNVILKKVREQKLGSLTASKGISLLSYTPPNEETWQYTTVVEFSTWDNIFVKFNFGIGTKVDVEVKEKSLRYNTREVHNRLVFKWSNYSYYG